MYSVRSPITSMGLNEKLWDGLCYDCYLHTYMTTKPAKGCINHFGFVYAH